MTTIFGYDVRGMPLPTMARMPPTAVAPPEADDDLERLQRIRERLVRPLPTDRLWGWLLPLAITAVAGIMRFSRLTRPHAKVFDEIYYSHDAWNLLKHGVELDSNSGDQAPGFIVHPPLGKWMIAVGEAIFGNTPLGWRFSAAVIGTLSILLVARIARRMFRSTLLGCVAGILLSFDGLEFVQSRTSMLDIFLMFWVLAAFGCLVLDRDAGRRRLADRLDRITASGSGPWLGLRPWRWACGFCLGAAIAVKWSGLYYIPAFVVLAFVWDWGARRTAGSPSPLADALVRDTLPGVVPFLVLPVVVYIVSWTGWFVSDAEHAYGHDRYVHVGESWWDHWRNVFGGWLRYHWEIYDFHRHLDSPHPYLSRPWAWLLLSRPVAYYYGSPHGCGAASCSQEVLSVGTPAIWWFSIPALVAMGWRMIARFDWRAAAILVAFLASWVPWFWSDGQHRTMFLFYLLPGVPFMVLALTMAIGMAIGTAAAGRRRRSIALAVCGVYLVGVVANFAYLRPILTAEVTTYDEWHSRMLLDFGCDAGKHRDEHQELAGCWI